MIELKKTDTWQKAVDVISSFISEGNFRFTDKGIFFKAIDPSQIVLVNFSMPKTVFDKYEVEPTFAGVDLTELSRIMSRSLPKDKLVMNINDSELMLVLEGDLQRKFKLPLIDVSDEEVKLADHKFDATVEIPGRILKESLKDASLFGTSVVLKVKGKKFLIEARGSQGTLNTTSKETKGIIVKSNGKDLTCKYSLSYLINLVKGADPETQVKLELKADSPMKVSYKIGGADIQFMIAHMML